MILDADGRLAPQCPQWRREPPMWDEGEWPENARRRPECSTPGCRMERIRANRYCRYHARHMAARKSPDWPRDRKWEHLEKTPPMRPPGPGWISIVDDALRVCADADPATACRYLNALIADMIASKGALWPPGPKDIRRVHAYGLKRGWTWNAQAKTFTLPQEGT